MFLSNFEPVRTVSLLSKTVQIRVTYLQEQLGEYTVRDVSISPAALRPLRIVSTSCQIAELCHHTSDEMLSYSLLSGFSNVFVGFK